ncbi:4Fe-4S binding protein [Orenia marismortui]|uniref:4Fe-4S binding protein n=1 Tax=Orenia marismortui TaxID=46469 RepID=UPI0003637B70|nr:4Fe-4S binding protein [Orenia marismortui]
MRKKGFIGFVGRWSWLLIVAFLVLGWQHPIIGSLALVCMIAPIIVAAWKGGRVWCGAVCPRGSFNDNILSKISRSVEIPSIFKTIWFRVLFFIFLIYNFISGVIKANGDLVKIGFVFYKIIFLTTAITILFGIIFNERTWCSFCPMGSLSALITKIKRKLNERPKRIRVDQDKCVNCKICEKECPIGLTPYDFTNNNDKDLDCLHCEECVYACPVNALERK